MEQNPQVDLEPASERSSKKGLKIQEKRVTYEKLICYISAFHINVNDWFSEYENIEIFNMNLQKSLGAAWVSQIRQAIKSPHQLTHRGVKQFLPMLSSRCPQDEEKEYQPQDSEHYHLLFSQYLTTKYQATNIAEAHMTYSQIQSAKLFNNYEPQLQVFFNDALSYACSKGYQVQDIEILKKAVSMFFQTAQSQYELILKKIESDQSLKINQNQKAL